MGFARLVSGAAAVVLAGSGLMVGSGSASGETFAEPGAELAGGVSVSERGGKPALVVSSRVVTLGDAVVFSGKVSRGLKGVKVVLQRGTSSGWVQVASVKSRKAGAFRVSVKPAESSKFRAQWRLKSKSGRTSKVNSRAVQVGVQSWQFVGDWWQKDGLEWAVDSVNLNGVTYPESVALSRSGSEYGFVLFDLGRKCSRFAATMGVNDLSPRGESRNFAVTGDGVVLAQGSAAWGAPTPIEVDLSGRLELGLHATQWTVGDPSAERFGIWFGDARALCEA